MKRVEFVGKNLIIKDGKWDTEDIKVVVWEQTGQQHQMVAFENPSSKVKSFRALNSIDLKVRPTESLAVDHQECPTFPGMEVVRGLVPLYDPILAPSGTFDKILSTIYGYHSTS
jgi:hypothetical protein